MKTRHPSTWLVATLTILTMVSLVGRASAGPNHGQRCQAAKNTAAGKYEGCRQTAEASLATSGNDAKYTATLAKCLKKYQTTWSALEAKAAAKGSACPSVGDQAAIQGVTDQHTTRIAAALGGGVLEDCPANLQACQGDLATRTAGLTICSGNLTTCTRDLGTCSPTCTGAQCPSCDGVCISTCATCPQTVTFTDINDAVPGKFFDAALSIPDAADPNILVLGLDTGLDPTVSHFRNFRASLLAFSYPLAADTISFVITAPCGYTIETVTFTENLVLDSSRTGRSFGMTQLVVNGIATNVAITAPPQQKVINLTGLGATRVPMSITTSLVAANEIAELLSGSVTVQVVPLAP